MNPLETILKVADIGGSLYMAGPDRLKMLLPVDCPAELKDSIRRNKVRLLALLSGPPFLIVRSEMLPDEPLFWTTNKEGCELLVEHGAPRGSVYVYGELDTIVRLNPDSTNLHRLCHAKRLFDGRIIPL
ncbi:MAG TPA: hypothetical protein VL486_00915 [Verrucomicrobiae bacterium]|nr:hypothetical protein [Verrucomicrobiae bacterium]